MACNFGGISVSGLRLQLALSLRPTSLSFLRTLFPVTDMSDPTKAETEQVFKVLKAQKANKVRSVSLDDPEEG